MIVSHSKSFWGQSLDGQIYRTKNNSTVFYQIGKQLGSGFFSNVYSLEPEDKNKKSKVVKVALSSDSMDFMKEFGILSNLPLSQGVQLPPKAFFSSSMGMNPGIVMTKYDGNLYEIHFQMTPMMKLEAIRQLLKGLIALYEAGIYLEDIKLDNILYLKKGNYTRYDLADFGVSLRASEMGDKEKFDWEYQKAIYDLGIAFKMLLFSLAGLRMEKILESQVEEMGLPRHLSDLLNYMIGSNKKTILELKEMSVFI
jgi:serine/threonine protein kinase